MVQTFGTGAVPDAKLEAAVREVFDLTPRGIITALKLRKPIYSATSAYGHFGRRPFSRSIDGRTVDFFTWERTDKAQALIRALR